MMETQIKYFTVTSEMVNVGLKGNDLLLYAIIKGFSHDQQGCFHGSLSYLERSINASRPTVIKSLKNLTEMDLISKVTINNRGSQFNEYRVLPLGSKETLPPVKDLKDDSKESLQGVVKNLNTGSKESLPNIKTILNSDIKSILNKPILEIEISDVPDESKEHFQIAKSFVQLFKKNVEEKGGLSAKISRLKFEPEVKSIRLAMDNDGITTEQWRQIFNFLNSPAGDFWHSNILSCFKLRKQAQTLLMQSKRKPNGKQQITTESKISNIQQAIALRKSRDSNDGQYSQAVN